MRHPDFIEEQLYLHQTNEYIKELIDESIEGKADLQENIKQAMVDLDYLDSSLSYVNILTNAKFLEMTTKDFRNLLRIKDKPYFSRIDFTPNDTGVKETHYIGKMSLYKKHSQEPVIIDWRSKIANLYYEGQIGEVSYQGEEGTTYQGELTLKRQYEIEKGVLEGFRDIDVTARDQMLQEALSTNADKRLKDIVSTIQSEQNAIIRAPMNKPLIVQGVAGSGKTTIAMHRIAYFIYTYAEQFNPEEMMIIAPNKLFLTYISDVLPELGVEMVAQTTFTDLFYQVFDQKLSICNDEAKLLSLIEKEGQAEEVRWMSMFKSSADFYDVLREYVKELEASFVDMDDLYLERYVIFKGDKVQKLFYEQYAYLPPYKRIDKIKQMIREDARKKIKEVLEKVEEVYDNRIEKLRYGIRDEETRRQKIVAVFDRKEKHLNKLTKLSKTVVTKYLKQFKQPTAFDLYKRLFKSESKLVSLSHGKLTKQQAKVLASSTRSILKSGKLEYEDLAPLMLLEHLLIGIDTLKKVQTVVIDEAQDYSLFQFMLLKEMVGTKLFTILGDLSQGIYGYRGTNDWNTIIEAVFPEATYTTLSQSYRTTTEIIETANQVISHLPTENLVLAKPVVRHGEVPSFEEYETTEELANKIEQAVNTLEQENIQSIAIISRSDQDGSSIQKLLHTHTDRKVERLNANVEMKQQGQIVIVPSYLAKGLEFDAVIVVELEKMYDLEDELDIKLLYVAMTRPLHKLICLYKNGSHLETIKDSRK